MKKIDRLLAKLLAVTVILFVVSLVFSNKEKNAPKAVQSAILNQKYKNEVTEIEIAKNDGQGSDKITLKKQGEFWLLTARDKTNGREFCTIADSKIISSLLEYATKIVKLYTISDKITDYEAFSVDETNTTTVRFSKDSEIFTKVYFGASDSLKNRLYLRSENAPTIWECENMFQQFLTTDSSYWSAGELLPEIKNPVSLSFTENGKPLTLDEKSEGFSKKVRTLLSLRHGAVRSEETEESFVSGTAVATLIVQDGNGRSARIKFFEAWDSAEEEGEKSYFYTKRVIPSEIDTRETLFVFFSENAVYEISSWTFDHVRTVFLH